jgi:archaeosine synthase beta-subunit
MMDISRVTDSRDLKRDITRLVMSTRGTERHNRPLQPRIVSYDSMIRPNGELATRKKIILMTRGCSVPTCTMCPFTNENLYGRRDHVDLMSQVRSTLTRTEAEPPYSLLALYNDGNFFAQREIPADVQMAIADLVAQSGVDELVVESLPQFITLALLQPFMKRLGRVKLEVGIGLQSSHSFVREICIIDCREI